MATAKEIAHYYEPTESGDSFTGDCPCCGSALDAGDRRCVVAMDAREISIGAITVLARLRRLRDDDVAMLMESIAEIGLREPVSVSRVTGDAAASGIEFVLVAGYHRLEACKRLRHDVIPAIVHTLTDDERQLWEVDENLCRAELTELERGQHLLKRKQIYERKHPETRQHVAGARGTNVKMRQGDATANLAIASFTSDTAAKIRRSARAIRRSIQRVEKIGADVRDRIWSNPKIADKGSELDALASLDAADQLRAVELVEAGTYRSIKAAIRVRHPELRARSRPVSQISDVYRTPEEIADDIRALTPEDFTAHKAWFPRFIGATPPKVAAPPKIPPGWRRQRRKPLRYDRSPKRQTSRLRPFLPH